MITPLDTTRRLSPAAVIALCAIMIVVGTATAFFLPLAYVVIAIAMIIASARIVDPLAVAMFWTLPYMIFNLPTGAFTLKLGEGVGYVFATAAVVRSILRRERWSMPPASAAVALFLAVAWISTACEPPADTPYIGSGSPFSRNSPMFRSAGELVWMMLSWLVVTATYNVVRRRPDLFRRCVVAHVLGGGLASLVSIGILVLFLAFGFNVQSTSGTGKVSVFQGAGFVRLSGVAYEPMYLAVYLSSVVPVTLVVYLLKEEWLPRRLSGLCLLLQFITLILSFSAGGAVGVTIALAIMAVLLRKAEVPARVMRTLKIGAASIAACLVIAAVLVSGIFAKLLSIGMKLTDLSGSNRHDEYVIGIGEFVDHPILGVGPGMTTYQYPKYSEFVHSQITSGTIDVHNIVLSSLGEIGVVGFMALCWAAFSGLRTLSVMIVRERPERVPILTAITASLIAIAFQSLTLDLGLLYLMYFTGLLSLTMAAYAVEHKAAA